MKPVARLMPDGQRLHLQHGPSDLIVWSDGARAQAFRAATERFDTIIAEVVEELSDLRAMLSPVSRRPKGAVARRMHDACVPYAEQDYVTPMAAVAGAIADEVLAAMRLGADFNRAYVNNGGDIALYLAPGTTFRTAMIAHDGTDFGRIEIAAEDGIGGIATSGRHGRSMSLGIADSVTALARNAAGADVAATLIANAVNLPGQADIRRRAACEIDDNSDLGTLRVTVGCDKLPSATCHQALAAGQRYADACQTKGHIVSAGLFLQGHSVTTGGHFHLNAREPRHVQA